MYRIRKSKRRIEYINANINCKSLPKGFTTKKGNLSNSFKGYFIPERYYNYAYYKLSGYSKFAYGRVGKSLYQKMKSEKLMKEFTFK